MAGRKWTTAELARLDEAFGIISTRTLARELGRTAPAVHQKALKRGLVDEDDLSLTDVRDILGLARDYRLAYEWLRTGKLVRRTKHGGRRSLITEADLVAFLRDYPHLIDRDKVDPAYRQFVTERWITLPDAFRRGAAHPVSLEHACHAGTVPEVRKRGVRWVIPESILPRLVEGRRRFTDDAEHRRQLRMYERLQIKGLLHRKRSSSLRRRPKEVAA